MPVARRRERTKRVGRDPSRGPGRNRNDRTLLGAGTEARVSRSRSRAPPLVPEIRVHYERQAREASRLRSGRSVIEFERQREILARFLPSRPSRILDIGGGPGSYSLWLAQLGHEVHLLDPVKLHVAQAVRRAAKRRLRLDARVGDARRLPFPDRYADAVLLMGPLYHLTRRTDRLRALGEARRVLRPGGWLFAVGISRFTSMLDGSWQGFIRDPRFRRILQRDLSTGEHRNPGRVPAYFTTAFFSHPENLRKEVEAAGFSSVRVLASEGFLWWVPGILTYWRDPPLRRFLLEVARSVEQEPSLIGLGPHLMVVARRPRPRPPRPRPVERDDRRSRGIEDRPDPAGRTLRGSSYPP